MDGFKHVQVERDGAIVIATLVNPPRNLMNATMVGEMNALADALNDDADARVLIFTVAPDQVLPEALALAQELAQRPRASVAEIKRCVHEGAEMPLEQALLFEQAAFNRTMRSEDAARLMRAYLGGERRLDEME